MSNNELSFKEVVILLAVSFGIVLGVRLLWAKLVYNDLKCVVAECRIIK